MVSRELLVKSLVDFETRIGDLFNQKQIRAPIHLYSGVEDKMIDIFKYIEPGRDWICCTWRNHYQALLKGVPPELLEKQIRAGKSMVMNLPEYRFICSSIVGGIPPIAAGIALGIKFMNGVENVWCWVGDMSAETGAFHEAYKYAKNHCLPITFVVESNGLSVMTPTDAIWRRNVPWYIDDEVEWLDCMVNNRVYSQPYLMYYEYQNTKYPHAGAGVRVQF